MRKQRVAKSSKNRQKARLHTKKAARAKRGLTLMASAGQARRRQFALSAPLEFYRPLKKPVTLRLDADVLAWFKKDGRRYQTRINSALRKVMEREIKAGK